jgi:Toprim domain
VQVKGAEKVFFGLKDIVGMPEIIIVEGEMDKLALEEAGFRNVVRNRRLRYLHFTVYNMFLSYSFKMKTRVYVADTVNACMAGQSCSWKLRNSSRPSMQGDTSCGCARCVTSDATPHASSPSTDPTRRCPCRMERPHEQRRGPCRRPTRTPSTATCGTVAVGGSPVLF